MKTATVAIALAQFTTFGDLLKYVRRRAGYTQRELSIAVGYSDTHICRLENNERLPDLATLTARFLPVLGLDKEPEVATRLLELANAVRREDAPTAGLPPYKGLHFFDEADADLFFGRDALSAQLAARLAARAESDRRFLAVVGASGSGKSSVVRAGLIPTLRRQAPSSSWPIVVITPTAHPLERLVATVQAQSPIPASARGTLEAMIQQPDRLSRALGGAAEASAATHALMVVDQFEELFTLCRGDSEQGVFVDQLTTAACQAGGKAVVVVVLRADFYAHCARFAHLRQLVAQHQDFIDPMNAEELRSAIEEPARRGHWELEPGLVEQMLHDVGADRGHGPEPGALPLLSHALLATWERRRGRMLTLSGYAASGGVRGAIAETAESVFYDQLDREQRLIARQIFLRLSALSGDADTADTRRRVTIDELLPRAADRETVHQVLTTLADARLVTMEQNAAEVAHEALIREWPTLRAWLEEDRDGLRLHRQLADAAVEWDAHGRDPDDLFRGARLAQAAEWAARHADGVNRLERNFLEASQSLEAQEAWEREAQRQRELEAARRLAQVEQKRATEQMQSNLRLRRRATWLAVALLAAAVLAVTALVFGLRTARAERLGASRELAAAAATNLGVDAERSVLLALQALETADTLEARNALRQAVPEMHLLRALPAHEGGVPDVAISPDGSLAATMGALDDFAVWELATGLPRFAARDASLGFGNSIAFSPDGRLLATAGVTSISLWNPANGEKLFTLAGESVGTTVGYNLGVGQISFSPDGRRLAAANIDGASAVWDVATRQQVLTLPPSGLPAKAIAYGPGGRVLVTGGDEGVVTLWDALAGTIVFTRTLGGIIHSVAFSPDGERFAAASEDGRARIWEAATGAEQLNLPRSAGMYDVAFLADGRLATAGQDGVTRVWDPIGGLQLLSLTSGASTVIGVAGSPDGTLIVTGTYDGWLRVWDATPGREVLTITAHDGIVWDVAHFPDGARLASAGVDGMVRIWEASTGRLVMSIVTGDDGVPGFTSVAVSPDQSRVAAGGYDGTVWVWDAASGEPAARLAGHTTLVTGLAFSPNGARLGSTSWDGTATVWDLDRRAAMATFRGNSAPGLAFAPTGETVYTGGHDGTVFEWDAATAQELRRFSSDGKEVYGVAVSGDGRTLAMGHFDGSITLWDLAANRRLRTYSGHAGLVLRVHFSRDGTRLASTGFDRLAKVWNVATGEELFSLYGNMSNVYGVSFSPDGRRLATAGADGTVRLYAESLDELVAMAQARLTRELSDEECRKFLHRAACP